MVNVTLPSGLGNQISQYAADKTSSELLYNVLAKKL